MDLQKRLYPLQMFAEDGGSAASAALGEATADNNQLATDTDTVENADTEDRSKSFEELIKGDYKEVYEKKFKDGLNKRMKSSNAKIADYEAKMGKISPALQKLAVKYGIDDYNDIDAIAAAVDRDNSYYEEYAAENGVTTEQAQLLIQAEQIQRAESARQDEIRKKAEFEEKFKGISQQAEALKEKFPAFDFNKESEDPEFRRWVMQYGISVEDAYTIKHRDEIMGGAMQFAHNKAKEEFSLQQQNRQSRPAENGASSSQTATVADDINNLSKEQNEKLKKAIYSGEKVTPENFRQFL